MTDNAISMKDVNRFCDARMLAARRKSSREKSNPVPPETWSPASNDDTFPRPLPPSLRF